MPSTASDADPGTSAKPRPKRGAFWALLRAPKLMVDSNGLLQPAGRGPVRSRASNIGTSARSRPNAELAGELNPSQPPPKHHQLIFFAPARSTAVARDLDIQRLSTNPPNRRPSRRRLRRSADLKASHGPKTRLRQSLIRQTPHAVDQPRPPPTPRCTPTALDRHSRLDSGGSRANGSTIGQFFSKYSYAVVG